MRGIVRRLSSRRWSALAALALLASAPLAAQNVHKDERLGFKVKVPRGWEQIPLRSDEKWIVGRYRSPKTDNVIDPSTGWSIEHNAEMQVVALLHRTATPSTQPPPEPKEKPAGEGEAKKPDSPKTYRNYPDYMKGTYGRGHYVDREESGTHSGLPVTRIEIKAERDTYQAEMRVFAWVFETDVADIAVQVEILADEAKKHRSTIDDVLKSFTVIPRTLPLEAAAPESTGSADLSSLTPAERKQKKMEAQRRDWERMTKSLPQGWTASEIDGMLVVNHVDAAYAKKIVEQIRAIYAWLDATFPEVGAFEHARYPIVRICADIEEENTFRNGSGSYWENGTELVTHKDNKDWFDWEWDYIGGRALAIWFHERDPKIWGALPNWLQIGLDEVIGNARMKSGKLAFDKGERELWWFDELPNLDEDALSTRTLLMLSDEDFSASFKNDDWKAWFQSVALTRYFVGARSKKTRQLLTDYMTNVRLVLTELEQKDGKDKELPPPKNEAEEEMRFKQRQEWLKSRERTLLEQSLARTFSGWSAADWKNFDREFRRSL